MYMQWIPGNSTKILQGGVGLSNLSDYKILPKIPSLFLHGVGITLTGPECLKAVLRTSVSLSFIKKYEIYKI